MSDHKEMRRISQRVEYFTNARQDLAGRIKAIKMEFRRKSQLIQKMEQENLELKEEIDRLLKNNGWVNLEHFQQELNYDEQKLENGFELAKLLPFPVAFELSGKIAVFKNKQQLILKLREQNSKDCLISWIKSLIKDFYSNELVAGNKSLPRNYQYFDDKIKLPDIPNFENYIFLHCLNFPNTNIINANSSVTGKDNMLDQSWEENFYNLLKNPNMEVAASTLEYLPETENYQGQMYGSLGFIFGRNSTIFNASPQDIKSQVHFDPVLGEYKRSLKYTTEANYAKPLAERITDTNEKTDYANRHNEWHIAGFFVNFDNLDPIKRTMNKYYSYQSIPKTNLEMVQIIEKQIWLAEQHNLPLFFKSGGKLFLVRRVSTLEKSKKQREESVISGKISIFTPAPSIEMRLEECFEKQLEIKPGDIYSRNLAANLLQ